MANITFRNLEEYTLRLSRLEAKTEGVAKRAIYKGAGVFAQAAQKEIDNIPTEPHRRLKKGELLGSVTKTEKQALKRGFGLTPMDRDETGDWNTKAGFDGYADGTESKKYPKGLPVPMLARSIEAGTSVRKKYPFVRKAVTASKSAVIEAMKQSIDKDCENIMNT